jgi:Fe-S-cluster-containing hydrogenase component 2
MIKPEKCIGCRSCELICAFNRSQVFNPRDAAVSVFTFEEAFISAPVMCLQCEDACCVAVCPVHAMQRDEDGTVKCDAEKCIGCKMCVNACPLGNCQFSPRLKKIVKCDECGGDPMCAKYCPSGCLVYTDEADALGRKRAIGKAMMEAFGQPEKKEAA